MTITRVEAQALAAFVARIRPDWDQPGIVAAIGKAADLGSPAQIGRALCTLAQNQQLQSPALLSQQGRHWHQDGEPVGPNATANVRCHKHTLSFVPCPQCAAENGPTPPPETVPDYVAARERLKAQRQAARLGAAAPVPPVAPTRDEASADAARERLEKEMNP